MEYVAVHTYRLWSKWPLKSLGPIGCIHPIGPRAVRERVKYCILNCPNFKGLKL